MSTVLEVNELRVEFDGTPAVAGVGFSLAAGDTLGIVGESGSGKSTTALALLRMLPAPGRITGGSVRLAGQDLAALDEEALRALRGRKIAMIFQDPMSSLNPVLTIGRHLHEALRAHGVRDKAVRERRALELLDLVGIPSAAERLADHPHQFSGGQRQRVMIALALANEPEVLVADEPTTALDATVQRQILDLLERINRETCTALVLITHDLGVVARSCRRLLVMRDGGVVEEGLTAELLTRPRHPYTQQLLAAVPRLEEPSAAAANSTPGPEVLLAATGLRKTFRGRRRRGGPVLALDGVDLVLRPGETLGIVGESGSGKSTLAKALVQVHRQDSGTILFRGRPLAAVEREVQMVFQDPYASLNPRMTVGRIIAEPMIAHGLPDREARVARLLTQVGLDPAAADRYPRAFSGGQRQRIGIARALAPEPSVLICDEPVSALDVSVQAQVIELLAELQRELGLAIVFIAHDLAVVRRISHRIAVLHQGRVVETGPADQVLADPQDPYTRTLLAAAPRLPAPQESTA
ncbi:ABC transporter ATP-binding protein [Kitasatospora sp. NBC_01287]|uniref:ABC transporter ATP-binding protein n=1 Tax=Kitasatospora sp. NBC_01287 TaxID=2903573 RepID=UPI002251FD90|nr:ABC transporter ATP-binding protein [Kitasatospora sp. NBC_01287]MCX4747235.1 ABC transporter ATP-binding protein [Kitasatospora sp. NBC_01287]